MTYFLMDETDYICDLGTSEGLDELAEYCPEFIESGQTAEVDKVVAALEAVGRSEDAAKVRRSVPPLIITDGVVDEAED